jgi:hypothetical protein
MPRRPHGGSPPHDEPAAGNGKRHHAAGGRRVDSIGRAAGSFSRELRSTAADLGRALDLRGRVHRHPYLMVAAAVGAGYVLGGGLFSSTTARLLGLAGRVATLPVLRNELIGLAEAMISGEADPDDVGSVSGSDVPSPS